MLSTERLLRVLAHPVRREILGILSAGSQQSVSDLQRRLGRKQSYVSQQLAALRGADMVRCRRAGQACIYSLESPADRAIVRAYLLLANAFPSRDQSCSFLVAGQEVRAVRERLRSAVSGFPCSIVDLVSYEPGIGLGAQASAEPILVFSLRPVTSHEHKSVGQCLYRENLTRTLEGICSVVQGCEACSGERTLDRRSEPRTSRERSDTRPPQPAGRA